MKKLFFTLAFAACVAALAVAGGQGEKTVKVGVLHSLSGTMSISEVAVKDATLLAIEEINAAGGLLGT
jgi:urea transport system substrate-binding protein